MLENCDRYSAGVVELVDTPASGAGARKGVEVQVLSSVPTLNLAKRGFFVSKIKFSSISL